MRVLIVDDEPLARLRLLHLCKERGDLDVIGQAESGARAIEAIRAEHPDLVLLDVELQDMTGFDVLRALKPAPAAIMVTMHQHGALQAFEVEAIDYLMKPVDAARFAHAIERARRRLQPAIVADDLVAELGAKVLERLSAVRDVRIVGENARRLHFLEAATVDYIAADGNYVVIHVGPESYISRNTMQHLESMLAPTGFVRIGRSALINLRRVAYLERIGQGEFAFILRTGERLVSNRSYRRAIIQKLRHS